ncbi:hypothetical protein GCM10027167_08850 [Nocardia heshunensis]
MSAALCAPVLAGPAEAAPVGEAQSVGGVQPVDAGTSGSASGSAYQTLNHLVCILFHTSLQGSVEIPVC